MSTSVNGLLQNFRRLHRLKPSSILTPAVISISNYSTQKISNNPHEISLSEEPWRDSASIILAAPPTGGTLPGDPSSKSKPTLPNILITKRSKNSNFVPNALCFPGGQLDPADCHKDWISLYRMLSGSDVREIKFLSQFAQIPEIYVHKDNELEKLKSARVLKDIFQVIPKHLSLRITAIRETFEECGILLCRKADRKFYGKGLGLDGPDGAKGVGTVTNYVAIEDPDELEEWQIKVKKDPMQFIKLCETMACFPDVDALVEWSNWLTPNSSGAKRFDTLFYMVIAPMTLPYLIDPFEVATARWTTANDVLAGASNGKTKIIAPQIYELTRLRNTKLDRLKQLMKMRLQLGIERICPCYIKVKDGLLSVLPGDDLYPVGYNIEVFEKIRELDSTLEELRKSTSSHHRIEFKTEFDFQLVVNIGQKNGQIYVD